eukprot:scaffold7843_cov47-Attheya_sp.AAC.2
MHPVLAKKRTEIRDGLRQHGTNVDRNDVERCGDGDQAPIHLNDAGKQFYRDLFGNGRDLQEYAAFGSLSQFGVACIRGDVEFVETSLKQASRRRDSDDGSDPSNPSKDLIRLLETRETSMRVSPLLMIVSLGKSIPVADPSADPALLAQRQVAIATMLLKYGARPDAKDVCGKTVCHYGAGQMATDMTMKVVDMCIPAAQSSHLFGKQVQLYGLRNESMNGKIGTAKGYIAGTPGRRAVYLLEEKKEMAIKPGNICLIGGSRPQNEAEPRPNLCDIQDRLGSVSLLEVFMTNRPDVAKFLLDKHNASIDVADWDGFSPKSMAVKPGVGMVTEVGPKIMKRAMKQGRAEKKADKGQCSKCGAVESSSSTSTLVILSVCARCKVVQYCSRDCQVLDWKGGHKQACKQLEEERGASFELETPPVTENPVMMSFATRQTSTAQGSYRKPDDVAVGEQFYIKVQIAIPNSPLLIYDKSRQCHFFYPPDLGGYREMYGAAVGERATNGTKAYLKASFDANGNCTVYPGTTTIKTW